MTTEFLSGQVGEENKNQCHPGFEPELGWCLIVPNQQQYLPTTEILGRFRRNAGRIHSGTAVVIPSVTLVEFAGIAIFMGEVDFRTLQSL